MNLAGGDLHPFFLQSGELEIFERGIFLPDRKASVPSHDSPPGDIFGNGIQPATYDYAAHGAAETRSQGTVVRHSAMGNRTDTVK